MLEIIDDPLYEAGNLPTKEGVLKWLANTLPDRMPLNRHEEQIKITKQIVGEFLEHNFPEKNDKNIGSLPVVMAIAIVKAINELDEK